MRASKYTGDQEAASAVLKGKALENPELVQVIGLEDGFKICTQILVSPPRSETIKERAIWLLSQLVGRRWSQHTGDGGHVGGDQYICNNNGIQVMTDVLASNSAYLQSHAAWILASIGRNPDLSGRIVELPAASRLLELMSSGDKAHEVPIRAAWAIAEISHSRSSNRDALGSLGAVSSLAKLLNQELDLEQGAFAATLIGAVGSLAFQNPSNGQQAAALLTAEQFNMLLRSRQCEVQAQAARALANIALEDSIFQQHIAASTNVLEGLSLIMQGPSCMAQTEAARALMALGSALNAST